MLYPIDIERKLGFDQIRERLKTHCLCQLGVDRVDAMAFNSSANRVRSLLAENLEFRRILESEDAFPEQHFFDPTPLFKTIAMEGSYLEPGDFLSIARSLETIFSCRDFLIRKQVNFPELFLLADQVFPDRKILRVIYRIVDDQGLVKDNASSELLRLRKKLNEAQIRLRKEIDLAYRHVVSEKWAPDGGLPTIRQGRLVIPVLAEYKRKLKGFILDESATGQTVFIEPAEALELNNEIRDLEHAAQREVIRILRELTGHLRLHVDELKTAYRFLAHIDFTRARARLAIELDSDLPQVNDTPSLNWIDARHPLLQLGYRGRREVVPLTINLDENNRVLLVSGPNAGGKSVCLKTVGLLQYMLQCGLLIPVSPDSSAGIFDEVFIDIGDEQSIENDLSTYSSHLKNLAVFIQHAGNRSLVLLDELGAGTDPNFGGAIAQAILEALLQKRVWAVATTHYYNLKLYAGQHAGIRNGAMRFDEEKLTPLFILDIGKPGSSFALEIARKTGIPASVLKTAEELIGQDLMGFDRIVRNLEKERQVLSRKLHEAEESHRSLSEVQQKYESLLAQLNQRKKEIVDGAKDQAAELLRQTNREIERTIRHIRENQAQRSETLRVRKNLQEIANKLKTENNEKLIPTSAKLLAGDWVSIIGQEGAGKVLSVKGKHAMVRFGELNSKIEVAKLHKVVQREGTEEYEAAKVRSVPTGLTLHEKQAVFNPLLDVRGKRAEEVIPMLDKFLDTAVLLGYSELRILHGKGEGILRTVVRNELKKHIQVETCFDEHIERGGAGITVVALK
jgi:DNA mismatch repair protein MutS2